MRFFDVVLNDKGRPVPNATVDFIDSVPEKLEVVPTVFIMNECMSIKVDSLHRLIADRVLQMCETHDVPNVSEIQIDCDWTARTQENFFRFMNLLKGYLCEKHIQLSATIRLHQLSKDAPPADRGVLMVYNTGDVTNPECQNPILDYKDVKPFLNNLDKYDLPLSAAYPVFSWDVLYRNGRFVGIQHYENEYPVIQGDTIKHIQPTVDEVLHVKTAVGKYAPQINDETIIFDLSDKNIADQNVGKIFTKQ